MSEQRSAAARAADVYNAASELFTAGPLSFWDRFGSETVERLALSPGARVLDLCSGAGGSALPAARRVGPNGRVVSIDMAERLLALAAERAAREGLDNIEFRQGDATSIPFPDGSFDAVVCVFGVFFAADRPAFVREMWRAVRLGGGLAVTTWGPGLFEPAVSVFWDEVSRRRPDLHRAYNPWDDLTTTHAVAQLLREGGVSDCEAVTEPAELLLNSPDDFWTIVLGTGYRATVDAMSAEDAASLRGAVLDSLRRDDVRTLKTDVVFATATRAP